MMDPRKEFSHQKLDWDAVPEPSLTEPSDIPIEERTVPIVRVYKVAWACGNRHCRHKWYTEMGKDDPVEKPKRCPWCRR